MNIERRQATDGDLALLYDLNKRSIKEHVIENFGGWEESEQKLQFEESTDTSAHEILLKEGVPFGFINVFEKGNVLYVNRLCIIPEYQSRGIGSFMLAGLIAACKPDQSIKLQVFPRNPALNLYRRLGFKEIKATPTHIHMVYSK